MLCRSAFATKTGPKSDLLVYLSAVATKTSPKSYVLCLSAVAAKTGPKNEAAEAEEELFSDDEDDDNAPTIFEKDHKSRTSDSGTRQSGGFLHFMR